MAKIIRNITALFALPLLTLPLGGCLGAADIGKIDIAQRVRALMNLPDSCFTCTMVQALFRFIAKLIEQGLDKIAPPAMGLLGVLYLVWLTIHILKGVGELAVGGNDLGDKFFPDFIIRTACVGFAAILIKNPAFMMWLLDSSVFFIIQVFVDLSITVVTSSLYNSSIDKLGVTFPSCGYTSGTGIASLQGSMLCLIRFMHQLFMSGMGFALAMFTSDSLMVIAGGAFLLLIFITYALAFPFYIMDAVVRMSFFLVMTPLLIVAWVFPYSRKFTKKAFDSFVGTGVQLAFLTMFMCFTAMVLYYYLANNIGILDPAFLEAVESEDVNRLVVLQEGVVGSVVIESQALLVLVFLSYYLFKASGKVSDMAGEFVGTMGNNIFQQMIQAAMRFGRDFIMGAALGPLSGVAKTGLNAMRRIATAATGRPPTPRPPATGTGIGTG